MDDNDDMRDALRSRLGQDYDPVKIEAICTLRSGFDNSALVEQLDSGQITADEYVDRFNEICHQNFLRIEEVMGKEDFVKFFDYPASECSSMRASWYSHFIDKETFLRSEAERKKRNEHPATS